MDTPSLQGRINAFADPVQARKDFVARQPMGRLGTVDDITGILVFLASDESLFATGNAYSIDGDDHMKLCRYGKAGYEKPGVIDSEGRLRDLSKVVDNIGPNEISPRGLKMLTRIKPETLPPVSSNPRLGVPYVGVGKFVAIGLNYSDHAKEAGLIPSSRSCS